LIELVHAREGENVCFISPAQRVVRATLAAHRPRRLRLPALLAPHAPGGVPPA
jgi:hypothetical protein